MTQPGPATRPQFRIAPSARLSAPVVLAELARVLTEHLTRQHVGANRKCDRLPTIGREVLSREFVGQVDLFGANLQ